jgi:transposase
MNILIGIDWSQEHHNVCIMNEAGAPIVRFEVSHSPEGFAKLEENINKLKTPPANCLVALETAHNLLIDFLWSRHYSVYVIAPTIVNRSRGRYTSSGAHDDNRDAFVLADLLRTDRHRFAPWKPDGLLVTQMRAKLSLVDLLTKSITRYSNRLHAVLLRYYPQMLGVFSDLQTQIGLRFLIAHPSPHAAQALSYVQFAAFCRAQGYTHPELLPELYAHLRRPCPEPDPIIVLAYQDETIFLAQLLLNLVQQKGQEIREVKKLFEQHPDAPIFDSLPGAGELLAPKLLVMFGDHRERFPTPEAIRSLAGTCPVTDQSGKKRRVYFRKACNRDDRNTAQQFAKSSTSQADWAAAYFSEALARGMSKSHAYRCLANRWLGIIWKLWQIGQLYDEEYHLQQIKRHRRRRR